MGKKILIGVCLLVLSGCGVTRYNLNVCKQVSNTDNPQEIRYIKGTIKGMGKADNVKKILSELKFFIEK